MDWSSLPESPPHPSVDHSLIELQREWLMQCLSRNRDTDYGRAHRFSRISDVADYQQRVPIVDYQQIHPLIERMERGSRDVLFAGDSIAFEVTSGSTSAQKLIPYSVESLQDFRHALLPWLVSLPRRFGIGKGSAYWAISPATRRPQTTSSGIPVGLPDSAYLGEDLTGFFQQVSAVPFWVAELQNFEDWQIATLYYLVRHADLNLISVWSPTFLSTLLDALNERKQQLESALAHGLSIQQHELVADSEAGQRLQAYYHSANPEVLWPNLKLISCWADASSQPYYQELKSRFDTVRFEPKGLLSTEAVVTVPDDDGRPLLAAQSGFYEFVDADKTVHLPHHLQPGQEYQVILTTAGGLYRYRSGDKVRCHGYIGTLPQLEFTGRADTSDLAGEKLSESFINDCLGAIEGFRMLLALKDTPGYCLVVDSTTVSHGITQQVERRLCRNPHYAYARKLGQLQPLKLLALTNPTEFYLEQLMRRGTRLGDAKIPSLCFDSSLFANHLEKAV